MLSISSASSTTSPSSNSSTNLNSQLQQLIKCIESSASKEKGNRRFYCLLPNLQLALELLRKNISIDEKQRQDLCALLPRVLLKLKGQQDSKEFGIYDDLSELAQQFAVTLGDKKFQAWVDEELPSRSYALDITSTSTGSASADWSKVTYNTQLIAYLTTKTEDKFFMALFRVLLYAMVPYLMIANKKSGSKISCSKELFQLWECYVILLTNSSICSEDNWGIVHRCWHLLMDKKNGHNGLDDLEKFRLGKYGTMLAQLAALNNAKTILHGLSKPDDIQKLMAKVSEINDDLSSNDYQPLIARVVQKRQELRKARDAFFSATDIIAAQKTYNDFCNEHLTKYFFDLSVKLLGTAPCDVTLLLLGSGSCHNRMPYSDIEIAILLGKYKGAATDEQEKAREICAYYTTLFSLFELFVLSIDETANIKQGYCLDSTANLMDGASHLIGTPEEIFNWQVQKVLGIHKTQIKNFCERDEDMQEECFYLKIGDDKNTLLVKYKDCTGIQKRIITRKQIPQELQNIFNDGLDAAVFSNPQRSAFMLTFLQETIQDKCFDEPHLYQMLQPLFITGSVDLYHEYMLKVQAILDNEVPDGRCQQIKKAALQHDEFGKVPNMPAVLNSNSSSSGYTGTAPNFNSGVTTTITTTTLTTTSVTYITTAATSPKMNGLHHGFAQGASIKWREALADTCLYDVLSKSKCLEKKSEKSDSEKSTLTVLSVKDDYFKPLAYFATQLKLFYDVQVLNGTHPDEILAQAEKLALDMTEHDKQRIESDFLTLIPGSFFKLVRAAFCYVTRLRVRMHAKASMQSEIFNTNTIESELNESGIIANLELIKEGIIVPLQKAMQLYLGNDKIGAEHALRTILNSYLQQRKVNYDKCRNSPLIYVLAECPSDSGWTPRMEDNERQWQQSLQQLTVGDKPSVIGKGKLVINVSSRYFVKPRYLPQKLMEQLMDDKCDLYLMPSMPNEDFAVSLSRAAYVVTPNELFYCHCGVITKIKITPDVFSALKTKLNITNVVGADKKPTLLSDQQLQIITAATGHTNFAWLNADGSFNFKIKQPSSDVSGLHGNHLVIPLVWNGIKVHIKIFPEFPARETAINLLYQQIAGSQIVPHVDIWQWKCGEFTYPVLVSETMRGAVLSDILAQQPYILDQIDNRNFSEHFLMTTIASHEDQKPANILCCLLNGKLVLYSIDNDRIFAPAFINNQLQIKSIIYCCNQFKDKFSSAVRERFLLLDTVEVLGYWIEELKKQNAAYVNMFDKSSLEKFYNLKKDNAIEKSLVLIFLNPNEIKLLYDRIETIMETLIKRADSRHDEILGQVNGGLANHYLHGFEVVNIPDARFFEITKRLYDHSYVNRKYSTKTNMSQQVSNFRGREIGDIIRDWWNDLSAASGQLDQIKMQRDSQKIFEAREALILGKDIFFKNLQSDRLKEKVVNDIDFSSIIDIYKQIDTKRQKKVLQKMRAVGYRKLKIVNCFALSDPLLDTVLQSAHDLVHLKLDGCTTLTGDVISVILKRCPRINHLSLDNILGIAGIFERRLWNQEVQVVTFSQLKYLSLSNCRTLTKFCISAPELELLRLDGTQSLTFENTKIYAEKLKGISITQAFLKEFLIQWKKHHENFSKNILLKLLILCLRSEGEVKELLSLARVKEIPQFVGKDVLKKDAEIILDLVALLEKVDSDCRVIISDLLEDLLDERVIPCLVAGLLNACNMKIVQPQAKNILFNIAKTDRCIDVFSALFKVIERMHFSFDNSFCLCIIAIFEEVAFLGFNRSLIAFLFNILHNNVVADSVRICAIAGLAKTWVKIDIFNYLSLYDESSDFLSPIFLLMLDKNEIVRQIARSILGKSNDLIWTIFNFFDDVCFKYDVCLKNYNYIDDAINSYRTLINQLALFWRNPIIVRISIQLTTLSCLSFPSLFLKIQEKIYDAELQSQHTESSNNYSKQVKVGYCRIIAACSKQISLVVKDRPNTAGFLCLLRGNAYWLRGDTFSRELAIRDYMRTVQTEDGNNYGDIMGFVNRYCEQSKGYIKFVVDKFPELANFAHPDIDIKALDIHSLIKYFNRAILKITASDDEITIWLKRGKDKKILDTTTIARITAALKDKTSEAKLNSLYDFLESNIFMEKLYAFYVLSALCKDMAIAFKACVMQKQINNSPRFFGELDPGFDESMALRIVKHCNDNTASGAKTLSVLMLVSKCWYGFFKRPDMEAIRQQAIDAYPKLNAIEQQQTLSF